MKKLFILSILSVLSTAIFAQVEEKNTPKTKGKKAEVVAEDTLPKVPVIQFNSLVHDYGNIYKNGNGVCTFEFKNTGKADLLLSNVSSSCGCTVPEWPKEPIPPGKTASIKVSYNTSRTGPINKNVFVDSNAGERVTLNIKGNVSEPPTEIAPENKTSPVINQ
jgi:ribosomal protein L30E